MIGRLIGFITGVSFHRGLALGALVGAALAGSTVWNRIRGNPTGGPDELSPKPESQPPA